MFSVGKYRHQSGSDEEMQGYDIIYVNKTSEGGQSLTLKDVIRKCPAVSAQVDLSTEA